MANDLDIPTHLNIRIEPKVRYLVEIAARNQALSLTEYVESALMKSLRNVYLDEDHAADFGPSLEERQENLAPPVGTIAYYAEALWSDNPGKRLAIRCAYGTQLMTEEELQLWNYIMSQDDLAPKVDGGRKPNYKLIAARWPAIRLAAKQSKATKGTVKK